MNEALKKKSWSDLCDSAQGLRGNRGSAEVQSSEGGLLLC